MLSPWISVEFVAPFSPHSKRLMKRVRNSQRD
jgi:hypothetical protein